MYKAGFSKPRDEDLDSFRLCQGDIIVGYTHEENNKIPKFGPIKGLMVLTYTCDLQRPKELSFLTLCPVFPIDVFIREFVSGKAQIILESDNQLTPEIINGFEEKAMNKLSDISQNKEKWTFFLTPAPILDNSPAYASLSQIFSIPIDVYNDLLKHCELRLSNPWRELLGWSVGNLFNRIATDDIKRPMVIPYFKESYSKVINTIEF